MAVLVADPTLPPLAQVCGAHLCSFRHRKEPPSSPPELPRARGGTQPLQPPPPCQPRPQESPLPPMPTPRRLPAHLPTASRCSGPANRRAAQDGGPVPAPCWGTCHWGVWEGTGYGRPPGEQGQVPARPMGMGRAHVTEESPQEAGPPPPPRTWGTWLRGQAVPGVSAALEVPLPPTGGEWPQRPAVTAA